MGSRGKTKVSETSPINFYPPKNKDPFYYKDFDGKTYSYRYYDTGKEYVASQIRFLRKRGYKVRVEWLGDEHYIIWRRKED